MNLREGLGFKHLSPQKQRAYKNAQSFFRNGKRKGRMRRLFRGLSPAKPGMP